MRCHEVRSLGSAFADSELDAKTSFEIEQHLQNCASCARHLDTERRLDERIDAVLRHGAKDEVLWKRIEAGLREGPPAAAKSRWWKPALLAAAACLMAAAVWFIGSPEDRSPGNLTAALATDHAKYLAGNMPPQFDHEPPAEILAKANGRLDRDAFHLLPSGVEFTPEGKRLCHIKGVPIAWIVGRADGRPVSVVALRDAELAAFPELAARFREGHVIACSESGGFTIAARRVADHVVCLVGDVPRPRLEALAAAVSPRS